MKAMMERITRALGVAVMLTGMSEAHAQDAINPCTESPQGQNIRVVKSSGGPPVFNLNGQPWKARGLQIRAFVSSLATAHYLEDTQGIGQETIDAQGAFGEAELTAAWQKFGANLLRFQVSQHDLDEQDDRSGGMPAYDGIYKSKALNAINLARSKCFVVIVSMQAEKRSGTINRKPISYTSTKRAWNNLLSGNGASLLTDRGVMLEIYNEPGSPHQVATADLWRDWAHASENSPTYNGAANPENQVFGMQPMIKFLRGLGSVNVLLADGLELADTFKGVDQLVKPIRDTLPGADTDQLVYAIHPYLRGRTHLTPAFWDNNFGFLKTANSANGRPAVPVLVTEWGAHEGDTDLGMGIPPNPPNWQPAVDLLNYLITQQIPMSAGAMDIKSVMAQQPTASTPPQWVPTNYDNYDQNKCPRSRNNAGLLIANMFKSNYSRQLSLADGITSNQSGTPKWCQ